MALRGLAQMALVTYIMLGSLITDTFVISSRKSPFHSKLKSPKIKNRKREREREGRVNKPGIPQPPQNSSFIAKK